MNMQRVDGERFLEHGLDLLHHRLLEVASLTLALEQVST